MKHIRFLIVLIIVLGLALLVVQLTGAAAPVITVSQNGQEVLEGGEIIPGQQVTVTILLQDGGPYKIGVGATWNCNSSGECSGTWVPNADITGAGSCLVTTHSQTTHLECLDATPGQLISIVGTAVIPPSQGGVTRSPSVVVIKNPSTNPEETRWGGIWRMPEMTNQLYLPMLVK